MRTPRVSLNFPRDACFGRGTGDFTGSRVVACQDFKAINLWFLTSKSICFIFLTKVKFLKYRQNYYYKCGVICNGKLDINIVRLLEKTALAIFYKNTIRRSEPMARWLNRQESRYKLKISTFTNVFKVYFFRGAKTTANREGNRAVRRELKNKFFMNINEMVFLHKSKLYLSCFSCLFYA